MNPHVFLWLLSFFGLPVVKNASLYGADYCNFDDHVKGIYTDIINLQFESAEIRLKQIASDENYRNNKAYLLLENESDFYKLFILDNKSDFEKRKPNRERRIKQLEKSNLSDKWKSFLIAEIELQWALVYLKQQQLIKGIQILYNAKQLLDKKSEQYPDFHYFKKSLGILQALLGTIPPEYLWASRLVGMEGNIKQGRETLFQFMNWSQRENGMFIEEAYAAYSFILCYLEHKPKEAFQFWVSKMVHREPGPLFAWVQAKIAIRAGLNEGARMVLRSLPMNHFERLPYLYYLQGLCELQALNFRADSYFDQFLKTSPGQNHIKEAWQKRAWTALLLGNKTSYKLFMSQCLVQGTTLLDEDQQAYMDAKSGTIPDTILLKARLLCDGGYTERARTLLENQEIAYRTPSNYQLEYNYRMARINHLELKHHQALEFYQKVITANIPDSYLVCNAHLQSGLILENQNHKPEAERYFETVLKLKPDRYQKSLHQKAKAGLTRLATK